MIRGVWYWNKETRKMEEKRPERKSKEPVAPYVIPDSMPPVMSMTGTDKIYDSKSAIRREYRECGVEEVGGKYIPAEPIKVDREKRRREIREEVEKTLNDLRWGNIPVSEKEKARCQEEERQYQAYLRRQR
jgi:hypothetical protein